MSRASDRPDRGVVHGFASFGAVEVHQMQTCRPLALPAQCLGNGVVTEAGDLVVIPLMQPHAGTVEQIDGGDDLHGEHVG